MFSYYGSKSKVVRYYPKPKFDKVIEPFAGSARYALRYFQKDVLLVDKYQVIVDVWHYLQAASEKDILGLPNLKKGEYIPDYLSNIEKDFMGFVVCRGVESPGKKATIFATGYPEKLRNDLKRIASQLFKIRHWKIICDDYRNLANEEAVWFIDPPYQYGGEYYKIFNKELDYSKLANWCKSRLGQVIVCENTKADWLPFRPMKKLHGSIHTTIEAIWSNYPTAYDREQLKLF